MQPSTKEISQYLLHYAEPRESFPHGGPWNSAVVVPARCEHEALPSFLLTLKRAADALAKPVLAIFVVNGPARDSFENSKTLALLKNFESSRFLEICILDYSQPPRTFHEKDGVGLARKWGCDLALDLYSRGLLIDPWIRTTDADVCLAVDYFKKIERPPGAAIYLFRHEARGLHGLQKKALEIYESWLHYYKEGLERAGSPYAFYSIGSTLAVHVEAYAKVRGFPKKQAGEDFYLLQKIQKFSPIQVLKDRAAIRIAGRVSSRVPFGTGPAIQKLSAELEAGQTPTFQNPQSFESLGELLKDLEAYAHTLDSSALKPHEAQLQNLGALGFLQRLAGQSPLPQRRLQAVHEHFDGLKTLRYLHLLDLPKLPWTEAIRALRRRQGGVRGGL